MKTCTIATDFNTARHFLVGRGLLYAKSGEKGVEKKILNRRRRPCGLELRGLDQVLGIWSQKGEY
jgi:hypothetical protein